MWLLVAAGGNPVLDKPVLIRLRNLRPIEMGSSFTYRIAIGLQQGRKVFTLQTLPDCGNDPFASSVGKAAGFSLHAGFAARAHERDKLERLCRYIARPVVASKRQ